MWTATTARTKGQTLPSRMLRHEKSFQHADAAHAMAQAGGRAATASDAGGDRVDVPCKALCLAAYKGALRGQSFCDYTGDARLLFAAGGSVTRCRRSRKVAKTYRRVLSLFAGGRLCPH